MNLLLIHPTHDHALPSEAGSFHQEGSCSYPPLGLLYLQASVEAETDSRVEIFDATLVGNWREALRAVVRRLDPRVMGIMALTPNLPGVVLTIEAVGEYAPEAKITVGGPHVDLFPDETVHLPGVDYALAGEQEHNLGRLLKALKDGMPEGIPGVYGGDHLEEPSPPPHPRIDDLDALALPDRTRIGFNAYRGLAGEDGVFTTMLTSRGCPYRCTYCSTPNGRTRLRGVRSILEEAAICKELGIPHVYFVDDLFPTAGERLARLCEGLSKLKGGISWSCRTALPGLTEENLRIMKRSGCVRIQIGVETGTDEGLRAIGKPATIGQIRATFERARRVGLNTMAYFMLGLPTDQTDEDVRHTIRFARELDPSYALFNVLTLYPGSRLYRDAMEQGIVSGDPWKSFARAPDPSFVPPVWSEHLNRTRLFALLDEAYRSFYWRPTFLVRQLKAAGGWRSLWRKARVGFAMLRSNKTKHETPTP